MTSEQVDRYATGTGDAAAAIVLDPSTPDGAHAVEALRGDPAVTVLDRTAEQAATLAGLLPAPGPEFTEEPRRWAYYPWRRALVGILGPRAYARVRTDRNRHLITTEEHQKLASLRVGIIGLSVGHAIAHTLAMQALCGELQLADFDELELSNLNRVPATVFDIGVNKATAAARRIAEIDPYLPVLVHDSALTAGTIDGFLDGLDIVIEECDSLDVKALVREAARRRGQPVLMATSDRGLVDVERFDLEPDRPVFHGLLGGLDAAALAGLDNKDKVPHVLRILEGASLSPRAAASLVEVGHTLATWPQVIGDVLIGASAVAEAVRRIGLGEPLPSGRIRTDMSAVLNRLADPTAGFAEAPRTEPVAPADSPATSPPTAVRAVALAANRAPSGGNSQPWHIEQTPNAVVIRLAPERTSLMDVEFRGSAVAVGAAVFNARVAAAAQGIDAAVEIVQDGGASPLTATVDLTAPGGDAELARLQPELAARETNRRRGAPTAVPADTAAALHAAARREGARLQLITDRSTLDRAGAVLADSDRIRYLTERLHAEMTSELRWPGDDCPDTGIDVRSLELSQSEIVILDILKRTEVMSLLASWNAGAGLGIDTGTRISTSSALAVVVGTDPSLTGYARGGAAAEAVWLTAQRHGLAVQPISPVFLYGHDAAEMRQLSTAFAQSLTELQQRFRHLTATRSGESQILTLRLTSAPPASVRSRRRPLDDAGPALF
ncbi:Rv1355c family protein [Mycobacterium sp. Y57]|uniref:Rv1355c family protein n=1 Tax=Mycolicibacterium xanthum TaxID=2796469 RepID=UPI001C842C93|nr:Rv1355c family protein [Mycolicibacterium xanthum]MBX7430543.1 Rv1355c family protein [Mycolicibacterium xanthum]